MIKKQQEADGSVDMRVTTQPHGVVIGKHRGLRDPQVWESQGLLTLLGSPLLLLLKLP